MLKGDVNWEIRGLKSGSFDKNFNHLSRTLLANSNVNGGRSHHEGADRSEFRSVQGGAAIHRAETSSMLTRLTTQIRDIEDRH